MDLSHRRFQAAMLGVTLVTLTAPAIVADVPKPASPSPDKGVKPLKVFILAGQSNMQGHASLSTFDSMADDLKTVPLLKEMRGPEGKPRVCEKVWISSVGCAGNGWSDVIEQKGKLTAGYGASTEKIGPEFTFGITMEKRLGEPILLIKTAWGGRSLHTDFRPPSAGTEKMNDYIVSQWKKRGLDVDKETAQIKKRGSVFYRHMIEHVQKVLKDIKRVVPDYDPKQGYELAGFVWFQGFNDIIDDWTYHDRMKPGGYDQYIELLGHLIRDVRKDLSAPQMPFVIGVMGIGGVPEGKKPPQLYFRQAQAAPASLPGFKGNVVAVETAPFWDDDLDALQQRMEKLEAKLEQAARKDSKLNQATKDAARKKAIEEHFTPEDLKRHKGVSNGGYHYLGAAKIMAPIGKAFAEAMNELLTKPSPERRDSEPSKAAAFSAEPGPMLHQQLLKEPPAALAKAAREQGDASRGAVVFYRPDLLCMRCHTAGGDTSKLGPDLAKAGKEATDVYLVESVLLPSKVIKKGFETVTITTNAGKTVSGLLAEERADAIVLRDAAQDGKLITVLKKDIDERNDKGPSLMPEGLVNVLSGRQEFLDLTRYLIEIAEEGPERARQLRPAASLFAPPPLPEYERDLDHAGLIRALDDKSFQRGETIYTRVCANCHGTKEQVGSMPTSLRFAEGKFKNGSDPLHLYQTLTHGHGMMTPQTWMVPQQKYDVIHYIREAYLKPHNPKSYTPIDDGYLAALPKGKSRGPKPSNIEPWVSMNYGPSLMATLEVGDKGNFAYKGIAVRLDNGPGGISRGRHWMLFDHDTLRVAAAWSGEGFIDWQGINFNGQHQVHPHVVGNVRFTNPVGPGWANPETGRFDDPRLKGRDGKPYGPLPRSWAQYKGMYHYGNQVILSYTVGTAPVLEMPAYELAPYDKVVFTRTLNVGKSPRDLLLRVAPAGVGVALLGRGATLEQKDGFPRLRVPAKGTPLAVKLLLFDGEVKDYSDFINSSPSPAALEPFTKGGPPRWPEVLNTQAVVGADTQAFATDVLTQPVNNPWNCQLRLTGFDFFADGKRAAVCTWDGDVWLVGGIDALAKGLTWQRIASGLFQPLGLKIVKDKVHVCCRDQIVILHDLNGDGETDFYECFNNDHQVTEHFHEFAMGLQTDADGNFYYAKAARHGLKAVVPQHGTLLKVSKDGTKTEILATGFRAPNGVCVNPDGTFFLTDQEGFWVPKNRIDLVERGGYYGNFWGYHDVTDPSDAAMKQPLVWITNDFDRSPSELLWVTGDGWGPLKGTLLNFSYGYGKVYVVPFEKVGGQVQGGMCELPQQQFPTGVMRGRFHPGTGQLYCCGMFAWAGNQVQPGGFYRVRYTGKPVYLPVGLKATKAGMVITFSGALDSKTASDQNNFAIQTWSLKRSDQYGSKHYDEKPSKVTGAKLSADGKTVTLEIEDLKPTWSMEIKYNIKAADGSKVQGFLHNTIHQLSE
jgi:putative heme-binding domain-containing protein